MFGMFKKKPQKYLFKVTYCLSALIDNEKHTVMFDLNWAKTAYVAAADLAEAYVEFAKTNVLSPHVYIHRIEKVGKPSNVE